MRLNYSYINNRLLDSIKFDTTLLLYIINNALTPCPKSFYIRLNYIILIRFINLLTLLNTISFATATAKKISVILINFITYNSKRL